MTSRGRCGRVAPPPLYPLCTVRTWGEHRSPGEPERLSGTLERGHRDPAPRGRAVMRGPRGRTEGGAMQVHARRDRLLVIAGFVVLAAMAVGIAYWAWQQQARTIRRDTDRNLMAVSRLKAEQVSAWLAERRADAETVRGDRLLANSVADLLEGRDGAKLRGDLRERLASLREAYHYVDVVLVDGRRLRGDARAVDRRARVGRASSRRRCVKRCARARCRPPTSTGTRMVTSASRWSRPCSTTPGAPSPPWCSTATLATTSSHSFRPGRSGARRPARRCSWSGAATRSST